MRKVKLVVIMVVVALLVTTFGASAKPAAAAPTSPPPEKPPIKIGAFISYTGAAALTGKYTEQALGLVLDQAGWEVAGRKIILIKEDETGDPVKAVDTARRLVGRDKVDILIGTMLGHVEAAVGGYAASVGLPFIPFGGPTEQWKNETSLMPAGDSEWRVYPLGVYAYDMLGYRRASIITAVMGAADDKARGFTRGFTDKGGTVIQQQRAPVPEVDFSSYIAKMDKTADCVVWWVISGGTLSFPKQYREYGMKLPLLYLDFDAMQEPELAQIGDKGLGMIGIGNYTRLIDTPENKRFVEEYKDKYKESPNSASMEGYCAIRLFLEGVKATGGDTTPQKLIAAMKGIKPYDTPAGRLYMTPRRYMLANQYICKVVKIDDKYVWKPLARWNDPVEKWYPWTAEVKKKEGFIKLD
jgi:branched-chain amino acid transport system substrate-binding protein